MDPRNCPILSAIVEEAINAAIGKLQQEIEAMEFEEARDATIQQDRIALAPICLELKQSISSTCPTIDKQITLNLNFSKTNTN